MPLLKSDVNILSQIERATGGLNAQNLAGYKVGGTAISAATVTSGYFYSGEAYTPTGYKKAGQQLKFCKTGCRPGRRHLLYSFSNNSYSAVTKYINSFPDGEIWVSDTNGARSGTKISKKLANWNTTENLPCGMLYSVCCLIGAGGGGGAAGLLASYDNNGGSGGVCFFISRWLRLASGVDGVTLVLGERGKGAAKGIGNDGAVGGTSYLAGRIDITGGGRATGGTNNAPNQTSTVSALWGTTYQNTIASSNGSDTSSSSTFSASYPAPEGGTLTSLSRYGGAAGSGAGYGGAGDGNPSGFLIWY
jgi:hypothetical protein